MRYPVIPEPVELENFKDKDSGEHPKLTLEELVRRHFVTSKVVMANDANMGLFLDIADGIKGKKPGEVWPVTDEQHELLCRIAREFDFNADLKLDMMRLVRAITSASSKKPEGWEDAPNGESPKASKKKLTEAQA